MTVALTKVVESTGKEKVPLLAVVVVLLVPLDEVRMTCSQCDTVDEVHLMIMISLMLYIKIDIQHIQSKKGTWCRCW